MSSQNAGTQSPKQQKEDPMGSADTEGGKGGQGLGAEQRDSESSGADQQKTGVSDDAIKAAGDSAANIADPTSARHQQ